MITDSTAENQQKSAEAGLNRRPLNLQSNALPLSYRRTCFHFSLNSYIGRDKLCLMKETEISNEFGCFILNRLLE